MTEKKNKTFYDSKWVEMFNCAGEIHPPASVFPSIFSLSTYLIIKGCMVCVRSLPQNLSHKKWHRAIKFSMGSWYNTNENDLLFINNMELLKVYSENI